jgi:hypothetical protein
MCATIASLLIVTNFSSSHAAGVLDPNQASASPAGAGAMLKLLVPFGGNASTQRPASLALTAGPVWQTEERAPVSSNRVYHVAAVELGVSLSGQPMARLGGIDLMSAKPVRVAAEGEVGGADGQGNEEQPNTGRTLLLIGLGVLGVIGIAAVVDWSRDCKDVPNCGLP